MSEIKDGRDPAGQALVNDAPAGHRPSGFDPSRGDVCCPKCGEDLALTIQAALPEITDLTISLKVEPGQLMRLDTMSGIMASWRDLQIAVGEAMGAQTEVYLADMGQKDNEFWFTGRITNVTSDSDGNPKGGDGTAPSRSDDSAGRQASPNPISETPNEQ